MTSVQVFAASILGVVVHDRNRSVDRRLVLLMGVPITAASFAGALLSGTVSEGLLLSIFAVMTVTASVPLILNKGEDSTRKSDYSAGGAVALATVVGFFGGMVGAPGAFLLAPMMMVLLKIPTRITVGSTLGIVLIASGAASAGKFIAGQIPYPQTILAVTAAIPGVYLGSVLSHRFSVTALRRILALLVSFVGLTMGYSLFVH